MQRFWQTLSLYLSLGGMLESGRELTSTSAGVSLQFRTSMTVMTSSVASSRRRRRTRTSSSVISGP